MLLPAQVHTLPDHQACWCCCSSIQQGRHLGDCVLTSLKERGDCHLYRWPKISLQNWKYCVFVPSIEISSKLTWRILGCFLKEQKDNQSLSLHSMIQVHSQTSAHSLCHEHEGNFYLLLLSRKKIHKEFHCQKEFHLLETTRDCLCV